MTIINRQTLETFDDRFDHGTVEVNIDGERRTVGCIAFHGEIVVSGVVVGSFGSSTKLWPLQLVSSADGVENIRVYAQPVPGRLIGRKPDHIQFER